MRFFAINRKKERGQALITAIIFLLALTFMGFGLITMSTIDHSASSNLRLSEEALQAAEEGVFLALTWVSNISTDYLLGTTLTGAPKVGDTLRLNSNNHVQGWGLGKRTQFEVEITYLGETESGAGGQEGVSGGGSQQQEVWFAVKIRSVGMVKKARRGVFDFSNKPQLRRTIEVTARTKVMM